MKRICKKTRSRGRQRIRRSYERMKKIMEDVGFTEDDTKAELQRYIKRPDLLNKGKRRIRRL
jgi:hypothetical protein